MRNWMRGYSKYDYRSKETDNSRNEHSCKAMHTGYCYMNITIPRDSNDDYEPQLIKKYQNTVTQDMEEKILSMYAKAMTTSDIESHTLELYDIDTPDSIISRITGKILPIVKEWQVLLMCKKLLYNEVRAEPENWLCPLVTIHKSYISF